MNYYEVLKIDKTATKAEIKRAYYSLAKIYHPDKGGDTEKMRQLNEAYEVLSTAECRNEYDGLEIYEENIAKSHNSKFHRSKEEQQARINFAVQHKDYLDEQNEKINNSEMWLFDTPLDKRIESCKNSIRELRILKEYCLKNGGEMYYADMFENCHNSKAECFSWEERLNGLLDFLYRVKYLSAEIQEILIKEGRIRQIDLIRRFPIDFKPYIMREIENLLVKNIIEKTKEKNAYVITLNETKTLTYVQIRVII